MPKGSSGKTAQQQREQALNTVIESSQNSIQKYTDNIETLKEQIVELQRKIRLEKAIQSAKRVSVSGRMGETVSDAGHSRIKRQRDGLTKAVPLAISGIHSRTSRKERENLPAQPQIRFRQRGSHCGIFYHIFFT